MLPAISVKVIRTVDGSDLKRFEGQTASLQEVLRGKGGVIDLWHTKCVRCPAALEKLSDFAQSRGSQDVVFIACALSQGDGDEDMVTDLIQDTWEDLNVIFVEAADKDALKEALGYSAVPFYVLFDQEGKIVKVGDGKAVDVEADIDLVKSTQSEKFAHNTAGAATTVTNGLTFDEDF